MSQGDDGRWWRDLILPILDRESGVYGAEFLCFRLSEQLAEARRCGAGLSLLLLEGQPSFGRKPGSAATAAAARALLLTARQDDVPARLGPRLFALLLPGVPEPHAARIGRRLELELSLTTAGTGHHWRVSCLSYPGQAERLERLAADVVAAHPTRAKGAAHRPAA